MGGARVYRPAQNIILAAGALPGGQLVAGMGGSVFVCSDNGAVDPESANGVTIDVSQWVGQRIYIEAECPHSGSFGAISRRRVGLDFIAQLEIVYDVGNTPEPLLDDYATVGIQLIVGNPAHYINDQVVKRYVCPSALLTVGQTIVPSKANEVVRHLCTVKANALTFLLPDQETEYGTYLQSLRNIGQLS